MGAEASKDGKEPKYENITPEALSKLKMKLSSRGISSEFPNKESLMDFYSAERKSGILSDIFLRFQHNGKLKVTTLIGVIDKLLGNVSDQSEALLSIYIKPAKAVKEIVSLFGSSKLISPDDLEPFLQFFLSTLSDDGAQFSKWMMNTPIFSKLIIEEVFPLTFRQSPKGFIPFLNGSRMIMAPTPALAVLNSFMPMDRREKWHLLFDSVVHGSSFSQLFSRVNGEGPCIILVESTKGAIFGCFASEGLVSGPQYRGDERCFLFEIKPNLRVHMATGRSTNYGYLNVQQSTLPNGLGMGGYETTWPFFMHEEFGSGICIANMTSFEKCEVAGESEFQIKSVEAWRIGEKPKLSEEEEERIRTEKSIIDKDPEAKALLEMSGHKMHSEAYREPQPILDEDEE
ncbi:unnamed protein product [Auanema sp. JU1783]|nr:unnamed protein product [Auanema sp. JU1783]